ncbi:LacI family transcriptional regulator [Loktanella sp. IMCC34160]|uniref:LacI family DNA-binding transcriptional regulator n=1 Tax=Loktanella sp. IMCC34160 TaxID=2510646 RepID=UPI00101DF31D|nr:LacI family DNA-binding transcriptional regulator [Loktanella sp. IMCC34160]RYG89413.1 LacI family transcriptional regulator [Loktanella sp. IMCC34160]
MTKDAAPFLGSAKPTQRTIARATGLAVTTVSKALAGDERIAEQTRRKVRKAALELGYVPDRAAQRLRTGKTNVISLVLDPHSELLGFGASMIAGIAEVVRQTPYHLTIMQYQLGEDPVAPIDYIVRNRLADGLIFARTEPDDARVHFLRKARFPFITHGRTNFDDHAWYDYDNRDFADRAVRMLARQGATRIGLVPPSPAYTYHRFMMEGFDLAIAQEGLTGLLSPGFDLNDDADILHDKLRGWLLGDAPPDGLICPGEVSAMAAHAVLNDLGRDLPLVVKQTSSVFNYFRPRPMIIGEDIVQAGRQITTALIRLMAGETPRNLQILAPPYLP